MTTRNSAAAPSRMADALPVLISYLDADRRFPFNNEAFTSWFNLDPAALNGRHLSDILGHEKSEELKPYVDAELAGRQVTFQTILTRSDGKSIYAQIIHVPQIGSDGRAVGFYSLVTDISEIRRSQQALSDSEALYHSLVDQLPMCLIQKDVEGRFTFVNRQFCEFAGFRADAVLGKLDAELFPEELAVKYRDDDLKV